MSRKKTKRDLFITFGDGRTGFKRGATRLADEVAQSGWGTDVLSLNRILAKNLIGDDWAMHESWMVANKKGFGFWLWKSIILKHALMGTFGNYERVVYFDAGSQFSLKDRSARARFFEYLELLDDRDAVAFSHRPGQFGVSDFREKFWGSPVLHSELNLDPKYLDQTQIQAGCLFLKSSALDVMRDWMKFATKDEYKHLIGHYLTAKTEEDSFTHRHDQSILSPLWHIAGFATIPDETWFGPKWGGDARKFPIWTIRNDSSFQLPLGGGLSSFGHKLEIYQSLAIDKMKNIK